MPPTRVLSLLVLCIAVTAAAQSSDVAITLRAPERLAAGADIPLALTVTESSSEFGPPLRVAD